MPFRTIFVTAIGFLSLAACSREAGTSDPRVEDVDLMCWRQLTTGESPQARFDHAMAVDESAWKIYLWGGRGPEGLLDDLWVFSPDEPAWRRIETDTKPPARSGHSLVFDKAGKRLVLFGGYSYNTSGKVKFHSDLWFFSPEEGWSREFVGAGPAGRAWHTALATRDAMVVFGGFGGSPDHYLQDIWSLNLEEPAFKRIATDGGPLMAGSPVLLDMGGTTSLLAFGPSALYVFGRIGMPEPARAGLWSLQVELDSWSPVEAGNSPDSDFTLAAKDSSGKVLLVGRGPDEEDPGGEWIIWTMTAGDEEWQQFEVEGGPANPHRLACASEPGRPGNWICFGGARHEVISGETWLLAPCEESENE